MNHVLWPDSPYFCIFVFFEQPASQPSVKLSVLFFRSDPLPELGHSDSYAIAVIITTTTTTRFVC